MNYDVIVIGAGLSGFMAAEAAQNEGARVLLLAKGMGSLPLTTGCIDGLGYIPGNLKIAMPSLQNSLPELARNHPQHPYLKVGRDGILASLSHFQGLCRGRGLPYAGDSSSAFFLPTALGTFHPTCLVPETMRRGDLSLPGPVLLLGFQGLRDFSPSLAAENLNLLHSRGRILSSFRAEVLGGLNLRGKPMNGLNLAWAFDEKDFRGLFLRRVGPLLKKGERLGLPAVLGFHSSSETWKDAQAGLDTEIFEVPLPPPSVPGLRLYNCLRDHLREKGVRVFLGLSELTPLCEPFRLNGFSIGPSSQKVVYRARAFVLATGKFFGGGLDSDRGRIYETLLGLPLKYPPHRREWFNPRFLAPEGHPFNSFGVEVDDQLRPVDGEGKVLYQNLFAAGGILAHADSMAEKSGGGVAVSTGYLAGKLAAAMR
jgi:glycerol-3-phosphate dehydrogenase subunit B